MKQSECVASANRAGRRVLEGVSDGLAACGDVIADNLPMNLFVESKHFYSAAHNRDIARDAVKSLEVGDAAEAKHQLERQIYFSNLFEYQSSSAETLAAESALKTMRASNDCRQTEIAMRNTWAEVSEFGPPDESMFDPRRVLHAEPAVQFKNLWDLVFEAHANFKDH